MHPDVDLADQDFKATIINIFIELKENVFKELKINVLVCQIFFGSLDPFLFCINFRINLSVSAKEPAGILIRFILNL